MSQIVRRALRSITLLTHSNTKLARATSTVAIRHSTSRSSQIQILAANRSLSRLSHTMSASARPHSPKVKQEAMEDVDQEQLSAHQASGKRSRVKREEQDEDEEEDSDSSSAEDQLKSEPQVKSEPAAAAASSSAASSSSSAAALRSKRAKTEPRVKSEPVAEADDDEGDDAVEQKEGAGHEALTAAATAVPKEVDPERVRILQLNGSYAKLGKIAPWQTRRAGGAAAAGASSSSAAAASSSSSSSSSAAAAAASPSSAGRCSVIYWMTREQRVQDNSGLLYAQQLAASKGAQLRVVFCLVPKYLEATERQYAFMLAGLAEVERELRALHIAFEVLVGYAFETLPAYALAQNAGAIVTDFGPLRISQEWSRKVCAAIAPTPLCVVDGHNVVPVWLASDKLEYAARTIRPKITNRLKQFLTDFPRVQAAAPLAPEDRPSPIDWAALDASLEIDRRVKVVPGIVAGTAAAFDVLHDFIRLRLGGFATKRNDPNAKQISGLSPYLHFGQIAPQRCAWEVNKYRARHSASVQSFIEELVVRRELSDNHCFYNPRYDSLEGASAWARDSLLKHALDPRSHLYTLAEFECAVTHDPLWNAAQLQMVTEGKMHGFLRMYWAKKILEWSPSPALALRWSLYLNDRFNLDGRDPNGYVGCAWSIIGTHDIGFAERAVFGKIRFMNYAGCKRKWNVDSFVAQWAKHGANPDSAPFKANQKRAKERQKEFDQGADESLRPAGAGGAAAAGASSSSAAASSSSSSAAAAAAAEPAPKSRARK